MAKSKNQWISVKPRIKYETWGCFTSVISESRKTNNVAEEWHYKFQNAKQSKHATIWKCLGIIRKDEKNNEIVITQLFGGHRKIKHPIKKIYQINNSRIKEPVRSYQQKGETYVYLHSIGRLLKNNISFIPELEIKKCIK